MAGKPQKQSQARSAFVDYLLGVSWKKILHRHGIGEPTLMREIRRMSGHFKMRNRARVQ